MYLYQSRTTWRDQFITQLEKHLIYTPTAADPHFTIAQGIQDWLLNVDKNEPDKTEPIVESASSNSSKITFPPVENTTSASLPNSKN
jgi:hypothetical protein